MTAREEDVALVGKSQTPTQQLVIELLLTLGTSSTI